MSQMKDCTIEDVEAQRREDTDGDGRERERTF
jgi:hypothetical protein